MEADRVADRYQRRRARLVGMVAWNKRPLLLSLFDRLPQPATGEGAGTRELAARLLNECPDEFAAFRTLTAWIALSFTARSESDHPELDAIPGLARDCRRRDQVDWSIRNRAGDCGWRDYAMRQIGERLGKYPSRMRRIGLFDVPIQQNHTATEIEIGGAPVFFDATFGIYFTDQTGVPVSLARARELFPSIRVHQLATDQGRNLLHGQSAGFDALCWESFDGTELMQERRGSWYLGQSRSAIPWRNADILRTYFTSTASSDIPRMDRTLPLRLDATTELASIAHAEPGFIGPEHDTGMRLGYRLIADQSPAQTEVLLHGAGLESTIVAWNDRRMNEVKFRTWDATEIQSEQIDIGGKPARRLCFRTGERGGTLVIMPTTLGTAQLEAVTCNSCD